MAKNLVKFSRNDGIDIKNDGIDIDLEKISDKIKSNKGKSQKPLKELTAGKMKVRAKKMDKERILTAEEEEKVTGGKAATGSITGTCNTATEDALLAAAEIAATKYTAGVAVNNGTGTFTTKSDAAKCGSSYSGTAYKGTVKGEEHVTIRA